MGLGAFGLGCCCESCTCLRVVIADIVRGTCGCTWCDDVNGTFDLEETTTDTWDGTICSLSQPFDTCNLLGTLNATLSTISGDWYLTITLGASAGTRVEWRRNFGTTKPTCAELAGDVPYYQSVLAGGDTDEDSCDATASTLTVSIPEECNVGTSCETREIRCPDICSNGNAPEALEVSIPASWSNVLCSECNARMSGTFILDLTATACTYQYSDVDVNGSYVLWAQFKTYNSVRCLIIEARIGVCGCGPPSDVTRWRLILDDLCDLSDCSLLAGPETAAFCCFTGPGCGFGLPRCRWDGLASGGGCSGETCSGAGLGLDGVTVQAA